MIIRPTNTEELRRWFQTYAQQQKEVWVWCTRNKEQLVHYSILHYIDVVEEALCWGWIDSTTRRSEDGIGYYQRLSPRRKNGYWTELNKERCRRLIRLGRMTEAGKNVLPDLDRDSFVPAPWIVKALQQEDQVWQNFQQLPPLYQRIKLYNIWFEEAKGRHESAMYRLNKFITATRQGKLYGEWNDMGRLLEK